MNRYDTFLFDLDGTLIDSIRLILDSYHHTLEVHGIVARSDEDWLRGVGTPLRVQFGEWDDGSGKIEELVATYRDFNLKNHDAMVSVYDGIPEALKAVRAAGKKTGARHQQEPAGITPRARPHRPHALHRHPGLRRRRAASQAASRTGAQGAGSPGKHGRIDRVPGRQRA